MTDVENDITFSRLDLKTDVNEFLRLHNSLFKNTSITFDWINWYFNKVANNVRVYAARDDQKLVGMWCVEDKIATIDGVPKRVGRCFSVGVDENYRRRNIFVNLSKYAIARERSEKTCDYIVGFPQVGRPVIDAHLKSGWYVVQEIDALGLRPETDGDQTLNDVDVNFTFCDSSLDGAFLESQQYLHNRWSAHPYHSYLKFSMKNAKGHAHIVCKVYSDTCHIMNLTGDKQNMMKLLNVIRTVAHRHHWREINCWSAFNSDNRSTYENVGFTTSASSASTVKMLAVDITAREGPFLKLSRCNFQMGNEEMY